MPAYALYSDPTSSVRYRNSLRELVTDGKEVSIVHLDEQHIRMLHDEQFSDAADDWDKWKKAEFNKDRLENFCKQHFPKDPKATNLNPREFLTKLAELHTKALEHDFEYAKTFPVNTPLSLYFWIVDEKKAVLSIPSFFENATEFGFITEDSRLIRALIHMHDRLRDSHTTSTAEQRKNADQR